MSLSVYFIVFNRFLYFVNFMRPAVEMHIHKIVDKIKTEWDSFIAFFFSVTCAN